ncbi:hypothetical protein [Paenibacillus sp. PL91]|nr:hypothetical protein [Paenibacillus sp. PL91]MBC9198742.1 hypothetical protein [Paenibacillus sp. PL91]
MVNPPLKQEWFPQSGGLGDTKEAIEQSRGRDENAKDDALSAYQNNAFQ